MKSVRIYPILLWLTFMKKKLRILYLILSNLTKIIFLMKKTNKLWYIHRNFHRNFIWTLHISQQSPLEGEKTHVNWIDFLCIRLVQWLKISDLITEYALLVNVWCWIYFWMRYSTLSFFLNVLYLWKYQILIFLILFFIPGFYRTIADAYWEN